MARGRRSAFGDLVFRHRRRLGMSQRSLANRTFDLALADPSLTAVSERTIQALEREIGEPEGQRAPRLATVQTLARALRLQPGTPDHEAFFAAAIGETFAPTDDDTVAADEVPGFVVAGREPHLTRLLEAVETTVGGQAGLVLVGADPGTGKSWLIEEACRRALARHGELVVLWTECTGRFSAGPSHEPFRTMLRLMVGDLAVASEQELLSDRNVTAISRRVPVALRSLATDVPALLDRLLPISALEIDVADGVLDDDLRGRLDRAIRQRSAAESSPDDLAEDLLRVLSRYAEAAPVLLVIEDLHRADSDTVGTFANLVRQLVFRRLPILLVGSWCPGGIETALEEEAGSLRKVMPLLLRLFPDAEVDLSTAVGGAPGRAFVEAMVAEAGLGDVPGLADALFERTDGLPLFVAGILRLHGQDLATADVSQLPLPAEVQTVFAEQLHRLPERVRTVLTAASVQGVEFVAEPVLHMLGLTPAEFVDVVDSRLVRRFRMLLPEGTTTVGDTMLHQYRFSHALLREYLLASMSTFELRHYHAATASAMLELHGWDADMMERIAFHLHEAGQIGDAAEAYRRAGDEALVRRDVHRALGHFRRLEALAERMASAELTLHARIGQGNALRCKGEVERARSMLDDAGRLAKLHDLPLMQAYALESLAMLGLDDGDMETGARRLAQAVETRLAADDPGVGRSLANLGYLLLGMGRYEEALSSARRAAEVATERDDEQALASACLGIGYCWLNLGQYERAISTFEQCFDLCDRLGMEPVAMLCHVNIALTHAEQDRWEAASSAIDRSGVSVDHSSPRLVGTSELGRGLVAEARGELIAARQHYRQSCRSRELASQRVQVIDSLAGLLRVAVRMEDVASARSLLGDIERRVAARGHVGVEHVGRLFVTLVEALRWLGDRERAEDTLRRGCRAIGERAGWIIDPVLRESYLDRVPAHRRIRELAAEADVDPGFP